MTELDNGLTRVELKQRATLIPDSAGRDAPATTDSQVTHVIAVTSGIRGVGKSSIAALLAAALHRHGLRVGLFDADIPGTSIPRMFGVQPPSAVSGPEEIVSVVSRSGIKLMALTPLLSDDERANTWHDALINNAPKHVWEDLVCGHLDYLIVNLPPGTSDVSLTVAQALPLEGVVLVTSPRDMAEMALREVATMFKHSDIPLIGLVDNMRHVVCPACGTGIYVFGHGQAEFSAQLFKTEILGRMPLDPELACLCDTGAIENYRSAELDSIAEKVCRFVTKAVSDTSGNRRSADDMGGR
ncbi:MAG: P-loop NTPase [Anaerolineales bacterium]|nr:P-loop NTPase [Anaerolineales bacterium]